MKEIDKLAIGSTACLLLAIVGMAAALAFGQKVEKAVEPPGGTIQFLPGYANGVNSQAKIPVAQVRCVAPVTCHVVNETDGSRSLVVTIDPTMLKQAQTDATPKQ